MSKFTKRRKNSEEFSWELNEILCDETFNIAKNPKYDEYKRGLASVVNKSFDQKTTGGATTFAWSEILATQNKSEIKNEIVSIKDLAEALHKSVIRKFEKRKVHSPFIDNIWGAFQANMQWISKFLRKDLDFIRCYWHL